MSNLFGDFSVSIYVATLHDRSGEIFQIRGVVVLNISVDIIWHSLILRPPTFLTSSRRSFKKPLSSSFSIWPLLSWTKENVLRAHHWQHQHSAHPVVETKHPPNVIFGQNIRVRKNLTGEEIFLDWQQSAGEFLVIITQGGLVSDDTGDSIYINNQYISYYITLPSQIAAIFHLCWHRTLEAETKIKHLE